MASEPGSNRSASDLLLAAVTSLRPRAESHKNTLSNLARRDLQSAFSTPSRHDSGAPGYRRRTTEPKQQTAEASPAEAPPDKSPPAKNPPAEESVADILGEARRHLPISNRSRRRPERRIDSPSLDPPGVDPVGAVQQGPDPLPEEFPPPAAETSPSAKAPQPANAPHSAKASIPEVSDGPPLQALEGSAETVQQKS